jgi:heme oxygenase (mycobilin-producing)
MIIVTNRLRVMPAFIETIEKMLIESANIEGGQQTADGFVSNYMLKPTKESDPFLVMSFWDSRAAYDAYLKSSAFKLDHAESDKLPREAFIIPEPVKIEVHEVIAHS